MYWVYVLWSDRFKKRYVGSTTDVPKRLREHNAGESRFTKAGIPWKVVHTEQHETLSKARLREMFLKSGVGRKWLDQTIL